MKQKYLIPLIFNKMTLKLFLVSQKENMEKENLNCQ